jgi:hypothetical protein
MEERRFRHCLTSIPYDGAERYSLDRIGDQVKAMVLNIGIQDAEDVRVLARLPYSGLFQESMLQEFAPVEIKRSERNLMYEARTILVLGINGVVQ